MRSNKDLVELNRKILKEVQGKREVKQSVRIEPEI